MAKDYLQEDDNVEFISEKNKTKVWSLRAEIDFIFKMLEGRINKIKIDRRTPFEKMLSYLNGLEKREIFDSFDKQKILKICYFIKANIRSSDVHWKELRKNVRIMIK